MIKLFPKMIYIVIKCIYCNLAPIISAKNSRFDVANNRVRFSHSCYFFSIDLKMSLKNFWYDHFFLKSFSKRAFDVHDLLQFLCYLWSLCATRKYRKIDASIYNEIVHYNQEQNIKRSS